MLIYTWPDMAMAYIVIACRVMAYIVMVYTRPRKYLRATVDMVLVLCRFGSLPRALKH